MTAPSSGQVYANANSYNLDGRTNGLNSVIVAWENLAFFCFGWSSAVYNQMINASSLIGQVTQ